jgi:autotransporter-associated beta strand protein
MTTRLCPLALLLGVIAAAPAVAQNTYSWQPTTSGNWNVGTNWLDQLNNPGVPLSGTDTQLVFNASGTTSYTATNDVGPFTLNRLTVNNTGTGTVTIAGSATNTFTLGGVDPTLDITGTALFTGLFTGSGTMTMVGSGTFLHDSNNSGFTGTLVLNGGTFVNRATTNATTNFNPVSIVVNNGATYQFGAATVGDPNLPNSTYVTVNAGGTVNWQEGETFGGFNLNGGTINFQQGGVTSSGSTAQNWTSGTLTGGAFTVAGNTAINKTTSGTVTVSGSANIATGTGGLNIQDGTIAMVNAANLGTSNVTLGDAGGTTAGRFEYQGLTASRAGTFTANAGGGTIAVTNAGSTLTLSGAFSGTGNLTKSGAGTLYLTGAQSGTGLTTVAAGTLRYNPGTLGGGVSVSNGATLAVNSGTGGTTLTLPTLALGDSTSTLRFDLNTASVPSSPLVTVSGVNGLTSAGGTLALTNQQAFATGTYALLGYTGTQITSGFNLLLPGRTAGSLDYATAGQINAVITGTDTIKWGGQVNGTWDVGTAANVGGTNNWRLVSSNAATNFISTDTVTFDDSASGNFGVTIGGTVLPFGVTVNNSANDYTFTGAGGIGGTGTLTKSGTGRLTVATANTYSGGTTLNAGTLQLGDGGTTGDLGTGAVSLAAGTTLAFNRTDASTVSGAVATAGSVTLSQLGTGVVTFGGSVTGTGTITKTGSGELVLGANNNGFTGTLIINGGRVTLQDISGGDLNAASIVVNTGGLFDFGGTGGGNPDLPSNTVITLNTGGSARFSIGEDYGGINLLGGTYISNVNNNLGLTSTFESGAFTNLNAVNGSLAGAGLIQKTTAGTVSITGVALNNTGGLNIDEGVLSTNAGIGGSGTVRLGNVGAATLQYTGASATVSRAVTLDSAGGTFGVTTAGTTYTLSGAVSGVGNLTKTGAGSLALSGTNTYTGTTAVNGGTLLVTGNSGGATGAVTVANGGTLGGTGTLGGATTVQSGGTVRGDSGAGTGTLTTRSVTVQSGGRLVVQHGPGADASKLDASAGGNVLDLQSGAVIAPTGTLGGERVIANLSSDPGALVVGGTTYNGNADIASYTHVTGNTGLQAFGSLQLDLAGLSLSQGDAFALRRTGNTLVLAFTPVPEPAFMLAACALAAGGVAAVRRLRRKAKAV